MAAVVVVVVVEVFVEAEDGIVAGEQMAVVLVAAKEAACGDVELEHVQEPEIFMLWIKNKSGYQ